MSNMILSGPVLDKISQTHDLCVFIARVQPPHPGHFAVIREAFARARYVVLMLGSANMPRCEPNPFTWQERETMVRSCLTDEENARIVFYPVEDWYSDLRWVNEVQRNTAFALKHFGISNTKHSKTKIALIGHKKDATSYYLNMFPRWDSFEVSNYKGMSSTPIRNAYFSNIGFMWLGDCDGHKEGDSSRDLLVPTGVKNFLEKFIDTPGYEYLRNEFEVNLKYQAAWNRPEIPYPVIFQTVDSIVLQQGHILLVRRRSAPGKGLWALPGGFLAYRERCFDGAIRELYEETELDVPEDKLRAAFIRSQRFDNPYRSTRGRTLTEIFLFNLPTPTKRLRKNAKHTSVPQLKLPKVLGSDDAEEARWFPISEVRRDQVFEDHYPAIHEMIAGL